MVTTIFGPFFGGGITLKKMTPLRTVLPAHRTLGPWCVGRVKGFHGGWKVFFSDHPQKRQPVMQKNGIQEKLQITFPLQFFLMTFLLVPASKYVCCLFLLCVKVACKHHSKKAFFSQQSEVCSCGLRLSHIFWVRLTSSLTKLWRPQPRSPQMMVKSKGIPLKKPEKWPNNSGLGIIVICLEAILVESSSWQRAIHHRRGPPKSATLRRS